MPEEQRVAYDKAQEAARKLEAKTLTNDYKELLKSEKKRRKALEKKRR